MKKILEVKHLKVVPINEPRKILVGDIKTRAAANLKHSL
jgi:hypothetical protein